MLKSIFSSRNSLIIFTILLASLSRVIPHLPNFTPIAAIALFGGAYFQNKKLAFIIPLLAMIISDIVLGFHQEMWGVYLGFILIILLGFKLGKQINLGSVLTYSLFGSVVFFIISNLAVWAPGTYYPLTLSGMIECYIAAIPFFGNSLLGDLFYNALLFGSFQFIISKTTFLKRA